jgi:cell wall-associated NlpC family hydrolase
MDFRIVTWPLLLLLSGSLPALASEPDLRTGDVVFQTSRSRQSIPIQRATRSPWSHVGIVERTAEGIFVLEAIQPVSRTPWGRWRSRGEGGRVRVMRSRALDEAAAERVIAAAKRFLGRPYDPWFRWDDERIYCSELVTKAFARGAAIELGKRQPVGELAIEGLETELHRRFGGIPSNLVLVTPASIAADEDLLLVGERP